MADFAPNYTGRYRVRYSVAGKTHKSMIRVDPGGTLLAVENNGKAEFQRLFDAIAPLLWADFAILSAEGAFWNSDIFYPLTAPTVTGAVSIAGRPASAAAFSTSFIGRTSGGLRWVMYLYGVAANPVQLATATDFRIASSENATILAATNALGDAGSTKCGNDMLPVIVYPYVNVKYNDYWTKRLRNG